MAVQPWGVKLLSNINPDKSESVFVSITYSPILLVSLFSVVEIYKLDAQKFIEFIRIITAKQICVVFVWYTYSKS